jgi:hypothetical protein
MLKREQFYLSRATAHAQVVRATSNEIWLDLVGIAGVDDEALLALADEAEELKNRAEALRKAIHEAAWRT